MQERDVDFNTSNYARRIRRQDKTPVDSYSHGKFVLDPSEKLKPTDMHRLLTKEMLLANISNDKLLRLYQAEMHQLANLASMAENDPAIEPFFYLRHAMLRAELGITRAFGGFERKRQDSFNNQHEGVGYGSTLTDVGYDQSDEPKSGGDGGGFKKFMPRLPKPNEEMWR